MAAAAAADSVQRIKAEATCSICRELLRDPVTTECGHSFCKRCITRLCEGRVGVACPQCRQWLPEGSLRPDKELRSIVQLFRSQTAEKPAGWNMCEKHQEPLKLYCTEDQIPICLVCRESQAHCGHSVVPMKKALQEYKGKIAEQLGVIESSCWKLHQFVSEVWKHLPENEQDEEHQSMKKVCEKLTTILKVHTGSPKRRFEDKASQPQPEESLSIVYFPGKEVSERTELEGHSGREPGSEPAAEKWEKLASRVGPVGEKAPAPKHELSQAAQDETIHEIRGTRGDAKPKFPSHGKF